MKTISEPDRPRASVGSPEDYVRGMPDLVLRDAEVVSRMTRGLSWAPEPERFLAAAKRELAWRAEQGVVFGWVRA